MGAHAVGVKAPFACCVLFASCDFFSHRGCESIYQVEIRPGTADSIKARTRDSSKTSWPSRARRIMIITIAHAGAAAAVATPSLYGCSSALPLCASPHHLQHPRRICHQPLLTAASAGDEDPCAIPKPFIELDMVAGRESTSSTWTRWVRWSAMLWVGGCKVEALVVATAASRCSRAFGSGPTSPPSSCEAIPALRASAGSSAAPGFGASRPRSSSYHTWNEVLQRCCHTCHR